MRKNIKELNIGSTKLGIDLKCKVGEILVLLLVIVDMEGQAALCHDPKLCLTNELEASVSRVAVCHGTNEKLDLVALR